MRFWYRYYRVWWYSYGSNFVWFHIKGSSEKTDLETEHLKETERTNNAPEIYKNYNSFVLDTHVDYNFLVAFIKNHPVIESRITYNDSFLY